MFAVIEFEAGKCGVVPIIWLTDKETKCYSPRNIKQEVFDSYVIEKKAPKPSWGKYKVVNIHKILDDYDNANAYLDKLFEDSSALSSASEQNTGAIPITLTKIDVNEKVEGDSCSSNDDEDQVNQSDLSQKKNGRGRKRKASASSGEDFSSDDESLSDVVSKSSTPRSTMQTTTISHTPSESILSTSPNTSTNLSINSRHGSWTDSASLLEQILSSVEHIKSVQDQQTIVLSNIERNQQTGTLQQLRRPDNVPVLPVSTKQEYKALEEFLATDENALYMILKVEHTRRRLAAIGGSNVRNTVMNILKFVLTNKVAMKFSWKGRDKRPFCSTRIMNTINEAVKLSYSGREPADLNDVAINSAVKDWLNLAKHRFTYSKCSKK